MAYRNHYADKHDRIAYKEGYDAGVENSYENPYKRFAREDSARADIYDEGYEDGKETRDER